MFGVQLSHPTTARASPPAFMFTDDGRVPMDQLSSCYFCGGALDASLSEYPVVPKRLRSSSEESRTVVLCQTCRRKLGTILEPVVEATGGEPLPDEDHSADMDEAGIDAQVDPTEISDANETDEDHPFDDGSEWESAAAREEAKADGVETETAAEPAAESDAGPAAADDDAESGDDPESDDPELTRLEYSKVMRLLENRTFPVDKAEIREVAESAYDIDPGEFDAVVDAAVDRGLIGEENGQFVAGE